MDPVVIRAERVNGWWSFLVTDCPHKLKLGHRKISDAEQCAREVIAQRRAATTGADVGT